MYLLKSLEFSLGDTSLKGWREALGLMQKGSVWRIVLPPELAYGESSYPPYIEPQATVIFEIELIDIVNK